MYLKRRRRKHRSDGHHEECWFQHGLFLKNEWPFQCFDTQRSLLSDNSVSNSAETRVRSLRLNIKDALDGASI
jgi:hypothetical protein